MGADAESQDLGAFDPATVCAEAVSLLARDRHKAITLLEKITRESLQPVDDATVVRAIETLAPTVETAGAPAASFVAISRLYGRIGQLDTAIDTLRQAIWTYPDEHAAALELGLKLALANRKQEALLIINEFSYRIPDTAYAQQRLGQALLDAGHGERALKHLQRSLNLDDRQATTHALIGRARAVQKDFSGAIEAFKTAARLDPANEQAALGMAIIYHHQGRIDDAVNLLTPIKTQLARAKLEELRLSATNQTPSIAMQDAASAEGIQSDLRFFPLPEMLEFLYTQRASGILSIESSGQTGKIGLFGGMVCSVTCGASPSLAEDLVREGLVDTEDLERTLLTREERLRPAELIAALVRDGMTKEGAVSNVFRTNALIGLAQMVEWKEGKVRFHANQPSSEPAITVDTRFLLLETMRQLDESQAG